MGYPCAFCSEDGSMQKWFVCPSTQWRPNMYTVCENHKDKYLKWDDVYPSYDCLPVTRHEDKVIE